MLAVLYVLENGLLLGLVPADHVDEAGLVAQLAAYTVLRIEFNTMFGMDHRSVPPFLEVVLFLGIYQRIEFDNLQESESKWYGYPCLGLLPM